MRWRWIVCGLFLLWYTPAFAGEIVINLNGSTRTIPIDEPAAEAFAAAFARGQDNQSVSGIQWLEATILQAVKPGEEKGKALVYEQLKADCPTDRELSALEERVCQVPAPDSSATAEDSLEPAQP